MGLLSEWMSETELDDHFGYGQWMAIMRFAILQKGKWRMIDDASHGHNQTYAAEETIHTTSAAAAAAVSRQYRKRLGRLRRRAQLLGASRDMKRAYKQISVSPSQQRFVVVVVWDIQEAKWRYAISYALPFGLAGAVLHFNRVPASIVAFCRRWLAIPLQHFFDDFRVIEPAFTDGSGYKWFGLAASVLGWTFDPEKNVAPTPILPMLGNLEDWSEVESKDCFVVAAKAERLAEIRQAVLEFKTRKVCGKSAAASIRGKLLHIAFTMPGRTGRGNYRALSDVADGNLKVWSDSLDIELDFVLHSLSLIHRRYFPLLPPLDSGPRCWTDAMFSPASATEPCPTMRVCALVANGSSRAGIVCLMPPALFPLLCVRSTQISIGELLAVCLAVQHFSSVFTRGLAVCFVDNMGVIHNIVNGTATSPDAGAFVHALHHRMAAIDMNAWWEYVPSKSNISDGGSRDGVSCLLAAEVNVPLREVSFRLPPPGFPLVAAADWDPWWLL